MVTDLTILKGACISKHILKCKEINPSSISIVRKRHDSKFNSEIGFRGIFSNFSGEELAEFRFI